MRFGLFSDTMAKPTEESILPAIALVHNHRFACLLAIGGGSAIDTAKAIALLASHSGFHARLQVAKSS